MKILHIYKSYYPFTIGGIEKHIYSLTESLHGQGIESAILTSKPSPPAHKGTIGQSQVYYFPSNIELASCPISLSMLKNFQQITQDYDLLHYHFPWPFADLMHLLTPTHKPTVVSYHSDIIRQKWLKILYHPLMRVFLNQADAIIASSDNYVQSSPILKKYQNKITVIPYGLDFTHYPPPPPNELTQWERKVGKGFFLFVGVLRYYKGLDFLLEAVRNTDIQVVIAGAGPEEKRLHRIKTEHKINNVTFVGQVTESDKAALYQLCHAMVAPSHLRTEAFCISLLESLIYGKPAISTELGTGTSFVNQHNISGLVVPPADPQALRQAMQLLLTDPVLYQRLAEGAKTHYFQYFTADAMRDKHVRLYNQLFMDSKRSA